jgi:hypothetical protein
MHLSRRKMAASGSTGRDADTQYLLRKTRAVTEQEPAGPSSPYKGNVYEFTAKHPF